MSQLTLLRRRGFGAFFWTQFLGAFNDNLFKNALVILIVAGAGLAVVFIVVLSRSILHPIRTLIQSAREIEGGNREINEIDLPCVLSIQTGINEPRYVGMRGIRQVASVPIPTYGASDLGIDANTVGESSAKVKRVDYFLPALGKGAEMLEGSREEIIEKLVELVAAKGGLK